MVLVILMKERNIDFTLNDFKDYAKELADIKTIYDNLMKDKEIQKLLRLKKEKEVIDKAIECIEKEYYSKNTVDIESIGITTNKLLQVRNLLKEVSK